MLAVLLVGSLAGCGGGGTNNGVDGGGGVDSGGSGGSGVTCDPFPNQGSPVTPVSHAGPPPAMTGGTLAEGTYVLTAEDLYDGTTSSSPFQETFVFANGTVKHIGVSDGTTMIFAGTYATSGTTITFTATCPQAMQLALQYTATATTFAFISPHDPDHLQTYTKQ